jgi:hypothetical protein
MNYQQSDCSGFRRVYVITKLSALGRPTCSDLDHEARSQVRGSRNGDELTRQVSWCLVMSLRLQAVSNTGWQLPQMWSAARSCATRQSCVHPEGASLPDEVHSDKAEQTDTRPDVLRLVVKIMVALSASALALYLLLPHWRHYVSSTDVVDQGSRPTILVSSSGGYGQQTLHTRTIVQPGGGLKLVFSFTVDKFDDTRGADNFVDYRITFSNIDSEGILCGTSKDHIPTQQFNNLAPSTQKGFLQFGSPQNGTGSATDDGSYLSTAQQLYKASFPEWSGRLELQNDSSDGGVYLDRTTTEDGRVVWAESCTLPESTIWRYATGESFSSAERKTFLAPRVAWTSLKDATDFQYAMDSEYVVPRISGIELAEAYPQPQVEDKDFYYTSVIQWAKNMGDVGNIGYTDQPVLIFSKRAVGDREALFIGIAGVVLGAVSALLLAIASGLFDAIWNFAAGRRRDPEN